MTTTSFALCNGILKDGSNGPLAKTRYPLEKQIRTLGREEGAYTLGIFDCCRENLPVKMRGGMTPHENDNEE